MNNKKLNQYSLDIEQYASVATLSGKIIDISKENEFKIQDEDGLIYNVLMHPKILKMYDEQGYFLDVDDDVDILAVFIPVRKKPNMLAVRCLLYNSSPYMRQPRLLS